VHTLSARGVRVNAVEWGAGPPVVLLHGLTGSLDYWAPFAARLARWHRVVAVDLPGHGGSDPLEGFDFGAVAGLLADAVGQLGIVEPALIGHSFGAPLAVVWAARRPVPALVLAAPVGLAPLQLRRARLVLPLHRLLARSLTAWERAAASGRPGRRVVFGWFVGMHHLGGLEPATARQMLRGAARAAPVVGSALPALDALDLASIAAHVRARTLIVWGEHDRSAWASGPGLADALGARQLVLPAVGHMPMLEAPYSFGLAVQEFLGAASGSGPARLTAPARRPPTGASG
jgi:pimeloyl-ACP methyl ester carboxylesterase